MTTEVEWRRKWKPGLEAFPWQPIRIKDHTYLLKYQFTTDSYKVLFTDLTNFWNEELSDQSLLKRIKVKLYLILCLTFSNALFLRILKLHTS